MRRDPSTADLGERGQRRGERHGADDVRAPRFLAVGQLRPCHVIQRHRVDRAAAAMVGGCRESVPRTDEGAAAEWGIGLVRRQGEEVQVGGVVVESHVDRPVGGELSSVDEDPPAGGVNLAGQPVDRLHDPGDVGCAGDGEQGDAAGELGEQPVEVVLVERPVGTRADVHATGVGPPGKVVRVVLEECRQHDLAVADGQRSGELVDRFGGVLGEHHNVTSRDQRRRTRRRPPAPTRTPRC